MELRNYQATAVSAVWRHIRREKTNPCVVIPTGGGKTPVIAQLCHDVVEKWGGRVLVMAHVKELLQQSANHLAEFGLMGKIGVYSAGLKSRDIGYPITVAGVQSIYRRPEALGKINIAIVDEAHRIPAEGEGMYRTLLKGLIGNPRLIGMTATPFRTKSGLICGPDSMLNEICYEIGVKKLMIDGWLCNLRSKGSDYTPDLSGVQVRAGEFVANQLQEVMNQEELVSTACSEILKRTENRKSVLVFAAGVEHGKAIRKILGGAQIYGDTPSDQRRIIVNEFRVGRIKYLVNVGVFTEGFDAPNVDCIVMLRPTKSPGLYYQMCGRGFRIADGKEDCLIMDYGGNVLRHGPVDMIRPITQGGRGKGDAPVKQCPECDELIHAAYRNCPSCDYEFPPPEKSHGARAGDASVVSGQREIFPVHAIEYAAHEKVKGDSISRTLKVSYSFGFSTVSEWWCFEHSGYAKRKACQWWKARSDTPPPNTISEAIERYKELKQPAGVVVVQEGKYRRVVEYIWDEDDEKLIEEEEDYSDVLF